MANLIVSQKPILSWSRSNWLGLALVGGAFVLAAALSWRRWPDLLVDFGIQLYLPWRISAGDVLYRDVTYLTGGPLSQYFNAFLFKIFGVSFRTLIFSNLAITAGMLVLLYRRFLAVADRLTATMIGLGVVLVFVFSQGVVMGNYNYVAPYSHEVFHGLMLAILVVIWLADWVSTRRLKFAAAAGFGSGLVFLTKPDIFLALMVCAAVATVVAIILQRQTAWAAKSLAAFALAALLPLLAFFALFVRVESWRASADAVLAAWGPLWRTSITRDPFYQWCSGLDMPFVHLEQMAKQLGFVVLVIAIYALAFREGIQSELKRMRMSWPVWMVLMLPLVMLAAVWDWFDCGRTLPVLAVVAGALLVARCRKATAGPAEIFPLLWIVFGLALMSKLAVFPRIWHYGFALAMPAFVGAVYLFLWLLPAWLEQKFRVSAPLFRATFCLVLGIGFIRLFLHSESFYWYKTRSVGSQGDRIMAYELSADPFHGNVETALAWLETNAPPGATLAVLPEGAMVNYLSRRVNPTRYLAWVPPAMAAFGQSNMIADFENSRPDYVVIIARSATEFGVSFFGYDPRYGADLKRRIDSHYERVFPTTEPGENLFYELQILKRRTPASSAGNL